ncbi:MAG: TetR/AcrR family transcriptional regulator [Dysgonomonas sp.]|nr:TetR/AcrR family transcriptional regulator [Dysgonomonas sp.]
MEEKKKRHRRTFASIENDIMEATRLLIEEKGISNLTLRGISKKAKIEASVFYNRYDNLYNLLEKFVERYDYWYSDIVSSFQNIKPEMYSKYFEEVFISLITNLSQNKSMQQILLWELEEDNLITRRTNKMREDYTKEMVDTLEKFTTNNVNNVNAKVMAAMLLSSIYFMILHKGKATFCGIDFNTDEGQNLMVETIRNISSWIFRKNKDILDIAQKMKSKGIDMETIVECTGLTIDEIEEV